MGLLTEDKSVAERLRDGVGRGDWSSEKPTLLATVLGGVAVGIAAIVKATAESNARARSPAPSNLGHSNYGPLETLARLFKGWKV